MREGGQSRCLCEVNGVTGPYACAGVQRFSLSSCAGSVRDDTQARRSPDKKVKKRRPLARPPSVVEEKQVLQTCNARGPTQHVKSGRVGLIAGCANVLAELGQRCAATSAGGGKSDGLFDRVAISVKRHAVRNDEGRMIEGRALVADALICE